MKAAPSGAAFCLRLYSTSKLLRLLHSRRAESSVAPGGFGQLVDFLELGTHYGNNDALRDSVAYVNVVVLVTLPCVSYDNFYLSPIIGINRSGRVRVAHRSFEWKSCARSDLQFVPLRNVDRKTSRNSRRLSRVDSYIFGRDGVEARGSGRFIFG